MKTPVMPMHKHTFLLIILLVSLFVTGCSRNIDMIQIKGSDTMVNLGEAFAEEFMKGHPDIPIAINGGGSGTGVAALVNGSTDIAQCSREMKKREIEQAEKNGIHPYEIIVASDGIAIVVSQKNPVKGLTIKQLSDIYTGKLKDWSQLGSKEGRIVALSRDRNSGTHIYFLEEVVKQGDKKNTDEFANDILMMPSTQAIVEEVASNPEAIGYIGAGYLNKKMKAVPVAEDENSPYIMPEINNMKDKSYPISRPLYFYTNGKPKGRLKEFIDFVLSGKGQKTVLEMGFVPVAGK